MQLTYRGTNYEYKPNPVPEFGPVLATGIYRGASVSFRALAEIPKQLRSVLKWRGALYNSSNSDAGSIQPTAQATASEVPATVAIESNNDMPSPPETETAKPRVSFLERTRALFIRHHQKIRQREQAMLTRLDEEVGLTAADAANYRSQIQGKVPHNFSGYDRSDKAMS